MQKLLKWIIFFILPISIVRADIAFEVIGVGGKTFPIAITPFKGEMQNQAAITPIVQADLVSTGLFKVLDVSDIEPQAFQPQSISYPLVQARGVQSQLVGQIELIEGGYKVRFWLVDIIQRKVLFGYEKEVAPHAMRRAAHEIADLIYRQLTGEPGIFSTKIAFVTKQGRQYRLQIADADGFGAKTILSSNEPIISPKWSFDGTQLAYVSFERKKPIIFIQNIVMGNRRAVAAFKGSNSAPAWSPDGERLAIVLTKDGYSQLYLIGSSGEGLRRLTNSQAIDTEPSFSPDGNSIIFTSDRGGSPQLYQISINGGNPTRLTYEGNYNASAKFSPNGKSIVMIHRTPQGYKVAVMDLATRQIVSLSDTSRDDSPSFAPNGRVILYESEIGGRGTLATVSTDGRVKQRLRSEGDIRQPAWGPLLQ